MNDPDFNKARALSTRRLARWELALARFEEALGKHRPPTAPSPSAPPAAREFRAPVARAVRSDSGGRLIIKHCPLCGGRHAHGAVGPIPGAGDGLRVPHCAAPPGDAYVIREVAA